jgi:hypothetical protein
MCNTIGRAPTFRAGIVTYRTRVSELCVLVGSLSGTGVRLRQIFKRASRSRPCSALRGSHNTS